jgi:hypothetical protein
MPRVEVAARQLPPQYTQDNIALLASRTRPGDPKMDIVHATALTDTVEQTEMLDITAASSVR